jgi:capsid protein
MLDIFNVGKLKNKIAEQSTKLEVLTNLFYTQEYGIFDGEKTDGELGRARVVYPDYYTARERAWELQLTNDVAKLVMNKWVTWLIGNGLRFNAIPAKEITGYNRDQFIKDTEFRFRNYLNSTYSDYSGMADFHTKAKEATYNAFTGGDVLCVLRVKNGYVTIQTIEGANVQTPLTKTKENILDGVEYDNTGKHVAYWVYNDNLEWVRIPAIHKQTGLRMAFMVYGSKFRLNETRGLPLLLEDFEKIKNLERYIEATVKNAEVSSELIFVNEHDPSSTGENVFKNNVLKQISDKQTTLEKGALPTASQFSNNLTKMTKGAALNNTIGAKLKMLKPDAEQMMPDFLEANLKLIFGSAGIPYEVAMSVYNSNYSASRAAIKDWEHNLKVKTQEIAKQLYRPFYKLWLYNEVVNGRIDNFELIKAYSQKDYVKIEALNKATFTGVAVPSIDPLKEVNAVRKAMGDETTPLMSGEKGAEIISQEDYTELQEKVTEERKIAVKPKDNGSENNQ